MPALDPYSLIRVYIWAQDLEVSIPPQPNAQPPYHNTQEWQMVLENYDFDGDGLPLYFEDANSNGKWDIGETDAASADTDIDGIDDLYG